VRLTDGEVAAIKACAREAFGAEAVVRVFGSRLDDSRRGGDIDLHIQLAERPETLKAPAHFRRLLNDRVGERAYDILVADTRQPALGVHAKALCEGVVL